MSMTPKTIHLCWFSGDAYPVEIKVCLDSWKRWLPDWTIRLWDYEAAKAIGIDYVNEALEAKRWAFAADAVRFYAIYTEGGLYMDSDIFLYRSLEDIISRSGFVTTGECLNPTMERWGLQAAFFAGEKGNQYCKDVLDWYRQHHYKNPDGTAEETISPYVMAQIAERYGFQYRDEFQDLGTLAVFPTAYLSPYKKWPTRPEAVGVHRIYGSWKKRKLNRRIEIAVKHAWQVVRYALFKR